MSRRDRGWPDAAGRFGAYGGRFVPETLMAPLAELAGAYDRASRDRAFRRRLELAGIDWRDLLVGAGLGDEDWPRRLDEALGLR